MAADAAGFDVARLARADGWEIWDDERLAGSGFLALAIPEPLTGGPLVIAVDATLSEPARRYAIAHELGHYELRHAPKVLEHDRLYFALDARQGFGSFYRWLDTEQEIEANAFAALLLLPSVSLHDCCGVEDLAARCGVPVSLATLRVSMVAPTFGVGRASRLRVC